MARKSQTFSEYAAERGIKVTPDFTIDRRGNFHYPLNDEEQSRRQRKALADYRKLVESGAIHDPTLERAAKAGKPWAKKILSMKRANSRTASRLEGGGLCETCSSVPVVRCVMWPVVSAALFLAGARVPPAPDLVVSCDWRISWHDTQRFNLNLNSWPSVACRVR